MQPSAELMQVLLLLDRLVQACARLLDSRDCEHESSSWEGASFIYPNVVSCVVGVRWPAGHLLAKRVACFQRLDCPKGGCARLALLLSGSAWIIILGAGGEKWGAMFWLFFQGQDALPGTSLGLESVVAAS